MKYHFTNFFGALLIYGVLVVIFSLRSIDGTTPGIDLRQGFAAMGVISGFVIAYLVTKSFRDHGHP